MGPINRKKASIYSSRQILKQSSKIQFSDLSCNIKDGLSDDADNYTLLEDEYMQSKGCEAFVDEIDDDVSVRFHGQVKAILKENGHFEHETKEELHYSFWEFESQENMKIWTAYVLADAAQIKSSHLQNVVQSRLQSVIFRVQKQLVVDVFIPPKMIPMKRKGRRKLIDQKITQDIVTIFEGVLKKPASKIEMLNHSLEPVTRQMHFEDISWNGANIIFPMSEVGPILKEESPGYARRQLESSAAVTQGMAMLINDAARNETDNLVGKMLKVFEASLISVADASSKENQDKKVQIRGRRMKTFYHSILRKDTKRSLESKLTQEEESLGARLGSIAVKIEEGSSKTRETSNTNQQEDIIVIFTSKLDQTPGRVQTQFNSSRFQVVLKESNVIIKYIPTLFEYVGLAVRRDFQCFDTVLTARQHIVKLMCWEINSYDPDKCGEGDVVRQDCNSLDLSMQHAITTVRWGDSPLDPIKQLKGYDEVEQQQCSGSHKEQMQKQNNSLKNQFDTMRLVSASPIGITIPNIRNQPDFTQQLFTDHQYQSSELPTDIISQLCHANSTQINWPNGEILIHFLDIWKLIKAEILITREEIQRKRSGSWITDTERTARGDCGGGIIQSTEMDQSLLCHFKEGQRKMEDDNGQFLAQLTSPFIILYSGGHIEPLTTSKTQRFHDEDRSGVRLSSYSS
ncbi:MAG: hypothetical protein EZS28_000063 [Streblomastix strix]|uniref:Uncharacterized protein n=1 Tax=Streblomastix strix TaxID=222440 RepID=A0A5J4XB66_9EUKA|nr:MAG: hypothetical protein EZS28_000063 [Streblomastix strix]